MAKYRKKPVVIEAIQWNGENTMEILKWVGNKAYFHDSIYIKTLEGDHKATIGDYIIKGIKGEFYPCKPDIFEMTYEKVDSENLSHRSKECIQYISETIKVDEKIVSKVLQAEDEYIEYILKVISKDTEKTESEENNYGK